MGLIAKRLGKACINATTVGTADKIVTNATTKDTIITAIQLYNVHTVAVTVTLCVVDDNALAVGTAAATDVIWSYSMAAGRNILLGTEDLKLVLTDTNDTLQAYASVADKVNIWVWGFTMADQS